MKSLTVKAPAKINLFLRVLRKRRDGYHEIETFFQKIGLYDELVLTKNDDRISLTCNAVNLPTDESNIAWKAAQRFFELTGLTQGVDIELQKNIPVAAGLGGGSSDAAAVLCGLNSLYECALPEDLLVKEALSLGADVPFFVSNFPAAMATGVGEVLEKRMPLADCWLVLVNPGIEVPTRWVYENLALTTGADTFILGRGSQEHSKMEVVGRLQEILAPTGVKFLLNDLETVTLKKYKEIDSIKNEMRKCGALDTLMSGSGSTVFALFNEPGAASRCVEVFEKKYVQVFLVRPLTEN